MPLSDLFETSTDRRRRRAEDADAATISQLQMDVSAIKRGTGLALKIAAAVGTILLTGASGTAWHFYGRSEQMAEERGAERVRLERVERDQERNEREIAALRAIVASLYPSLRNLPVIPPVNGDDR